MFALEANELPLALGTASRGAQSFHVIGEPFAQVFKPLVSIAVEVVNAVLNVFR